MAPGLVARHGAGEGHGQHRFVEHRDDPAHGAHEVVAVRCPALGARPLQIDDELREDRGQQVGDRLGGDALLGEDVVDAFHLAAFQVVDGEPFAAGEADRGLGGVAVGVEGNLGGRSPVLLFERGRFVGHALAHHDQATRAREHLDRLVGDAGLIEGGRHHLAQLLGCGMQIERGNLLDADFECERMRTSHATPLPLRRRRARCPPRVPCRWRSSSSPASAHAGCRPCARWRKSRHARRAG